jgi:hypothetical protein
MLSCRVGPRSRPLYGVARSAAIPSACQRARGLPTETAAGDCRVSHACFNRSSAFDNPSVESLMMRGGLVVSNGSDSMMSMLSRVAAASKRAKEADVYRASNQPVSSGSIFAMDAARGNESSIDTAAVSFDPGLRK